MRKTLQKTPKPAGNDFRLRDLSGVSPAMGEIKRLSPRQKAWGIVGAAPEVFVTLNPPLSKGRRLCIQSYRGAAAQAAYISRSWRLPMTDSEGRLCRTTGAVHGELRGWCLDIARTQRDMRVVDQYIIGVNGEVDRGRFERACLSWCEAHLEGRPWLAGFHYDRAGHPHAHVLFRHRHWETGRAYGRSPAECRALREDLAARLLEQGISANATSRATRGVFGPAPHYVQQRLLKESGEKVSPEVAKKIEAEALRAVEAREVIEPAADRGRTVRAQIFSYAKGFIEHELKPSGAPEDLELARRLEAYYRTMPPVRGLVEARALEIVKERQREAEQREEMEEMAAAVEEAEREWERGRDRGGPER